MPSDVYAVIESWLRRRVAHIIVGGNQSDAMMLENMVFQGTVWGPPLWNAFYADSKRPIRKAGFQEIVFADDLNAWKKVAAGTSHERMLADMKICQSELHQWGSANCEGMLVLSRKQPYGESFDLLGIRFDCKLVMSSTVEELARTCRWKLRAILRTKRYNTSARLISLYKTQLLSFIEYRTAAIYHVCDTALALLDDVQDKILKVAGITKTEALNDHRLAPLSVRRDIAMLGLIHRTVIGRGPAHFRSVFKADVHARMAGAGKHRLQLQPLPDHYSDFSLPGSAPAQYIQNSAHGLVKVYNLLPASIVEASACVPSFQKALQRLVQDRANDGCSNWELTLSPRIPVYKHPLRDLR